MSTREQLDKNVVDALAAANVAYAVADPDAADAWHDAAWDAADAWVKAKRKLNKYLTEQDSA